MPSLGISVVGFPSAIRLLSSVTPQPASAKKQTRPGISFLLICSSFALLTVRRSPLASCYKRNHPSVRVFKAVVSQTPLFSLAVAKYHAKTNLDRLAMVVIACLPYVSVAQTTPTAGCVARLDELLSTSSPYAKLVARELKCLVATTESAVRPASTPAADPATRQFSIASSGKLHAASPTASSPPAGVLLDRTLETHRSTGLRQGSPTINPEMSDAIRSALKAVSALPPGRPLPEELSTRIRLLLEQVDALGK